MIMGGVRSCAIARWRRCSRRSPSWSTNSSATPGGQGGDNIDLRIATHHHGIHVEVVPRDAPRRTNRLPSTRYVEPLTRAERHVLPYLATNLTYPLIAEQLCVSRHTVKTHAIAIYRKLGVSSRNAAVDAAQELGLLTQRLRLVP